MKRLLVQAQAGSIEDLTAIISLYRPGPMQFIPRLSGEQEESRRIRTLPP